MPSKISIEHCSALPTYSKNVRVVYNSFSPSSKLSGLRNKNSQSAIELLLAQPALRDKLMKAYMGNYGVVLSLVGCLDSGLQTKKLVDRIIDDCASRI